MCFCVKAWFDNTLTHADGHTLTYPDTHTHTQVTGSTLPPFPISYDEYVRLSVVLQKGGPQVAKDAVLSVLRSIAFPVRARWGTFDGAFHSYRCVRGAYMTIAAPVRPPKHTQGFSQIFRALFPGSSRLACEFNARITPVFFQWLVGPATVEAAEVVNPRTCVRTSLWGLDCVRVFGGWIYVHIRRSVGLCMHVEAASNQPD